MAKRICVGIVILLAVLISIRFLITWFALRPAGKRPMFSEWRTVAEKADWCYERFYDRQCNLVYTDVHVNQVVVILSRSHDWKTVSSWRSLTPTRAEFETESGRYSVSLNPNTITLVIDPGKAITLAVEEAFSICIRNGGKLEQDQCDVLQLVHSRLGERERGALNAFISKYYAVATSTSPD